ncbi:ATP-binding protein [candidate division KSB3 bacterium]|uniref:histidine kinase n=1 Tax=candidate division KSB3 bacterium TaxID=2044937 RepID=A0A2G6E672_9BACT|nr:MAG: ATP-binding protein [candidate division KSB3 bacterium]
MKELSLHILDIVQNSTKAGATVITVEVIELLRRNLLKIMIRDNGCGMSKEALATITDPFSTSRTTRKVGLGLSLLQAAAEKCNGAMSIESEQGKGTVVTATFRHDHIDRVPLGDIVSTLITVIAGHPDIDFCYRHHMNEHVFEFNTVDVKRELGELSIADMSVIQFLSDYLHRNIEQLYKEGQA